MNDSSILKLPVLPEVVPDSARPTWRRVELGPAENDAEMAIAAAPSAEDPRPFVGERPGFVARIARERGGDAVAFRIALDPETIWDEDFATVIAATIDVDDRTAIAGAWLGIGEAGVVVHQYPISPPWPLHAASGWRFADRPRDAFLQIRVALRKCETPIRLAATRIFAGQGYDPNGFNPRFIAVVAGAEATPIRDADEVLAEFDAAARSASKTASYIREQAFIRPCIVMREGALRFPLLLGTVNSLHWCGQIPAHGLDEYADFGYVAAGDVVFDCGANCGETVSYFAIAAGPSGRVVAFDPFIQNCLQCEAQARLNAPGRVRVVAAGVGAKRRKLLVSNCAQKTVESASEPPPDLTEIEIVRIDDFIDAAPTLIKIRVEGAEVDALIGAEQTLRRHTPKLFIEVHTQFLPEFGYSLADLFARIPSNLYDINVIVEGADAQWRKYEPGLEFGVTAPMRVFAVPRAIAVDAQFMRRRRTFASLFERIIFEREEEIRRLGGVVREREGVVLNLESTVRQREREIASLIDAVREREANIETLAGVVGQRENAIAKAGELLLAREASIRSLEEENERRSALLLQREQRILDLEVHEVEVVGLREAEIDDMAGVIREREANIAALEDLARRKDGEIRQVADILVQRESTIDHVEKIIRAREKEIESVASIIRSREERIVTLERLLADPRSRELPAGWSALPLEEKISRCLETIDGWCSPAKAAWLRRLIVSRGATRVLEIGIFGGKSLIPMALAVQSLGAGVVIGVEPWAADVAISEPTNEINDEWWRNVDFAQVKQRFFANAALYRVLPMIKVMETDSESAFRFLKPGGAQFDLVHIDGAHSPQRALRDAKTWSKLVKKGGLVVFDDIGWPSVKRARNFLRRNLSVVDEVTESASVSYGAYEVW